MKGLIILKSIVKQDFRDKEKIFFSIVFPILFMIIFGFVFGENQGNSLTIGYAGIKNADLIQTINSFNYKIKFYNNLLELKKSLKRQKIDFGIFNSKGEITGVLNKSDIQNYQTFKNAFDLIIKNYSLKVSKVKKLFNSKSISLFGTSNNGLGYLIPGIIGLSIMSSSMFAAIEIISSYKKSKILKRFAVTPLKPLTFLFSSFLSKLILSFVSAYIVLITGLLIFGIRFNINYISLTIIILNSSILMFAFGTLLALIFKKPETSNNVGSILFTIMMFFSGIYFPIKFLPHYLQIASLFLPATYIAQFMRYAFGVENLSLIYIYTFNLSVIAISAILLPLISKRLFVLREE